MAYPFVVAILMSLTICFVGKHGPYMLHSLLKDCNRDAFLLHKLSKTNPVLGDMPEPAGESHFNLNT